MMMMMMMIMMMMMMIMSHPLAQSLRTARQDEGLKAAGPACGDPREGGQVEAIVGMASEGVGGAS